MQTLVNFFAQFNDLYIKKKYEQAEFFYSKSNYKLLSLFLTYGILKKLQIIKKNNIYKILVIFNYFDNKPLLSFIGVVSTGSLKVYKSVPQLKLLLYKKQLVKYIISTSQGIFLAEDCVKKKIGGKVLGKFY